MALTLDQWFDKIEPLFPNWFFEDRDHQIAYLYGMAAVFRQVQLDSEQHVTETFIGDASGQYLDAHGAERDIDRIDGEFDAQYSVRVQSLKNKSNPPTIKSIVDALLISGECEILEDFSSGVFMNREDFMNRGDIFIDEEIWNTFSVIVDKQLHEPYSFADREYFMDREDFMGAALSLDYVFNLIVEAVNDAKALGTLYRIIERTGE